MILIKNNEINIDVTTYLKNEISSSFKKKICHIFPGKYVQQGSKKLGLTMQFSENPTKFQLSFIIAANFRLDIEQVQSPRSSHQTCSIKKGDLKNFAKFTGKQLCQSLFLNKGLRPATLLKKRLWHKCLPVNFAKFTRTPFLQNISGRLLLVTFLGWYERG